MATSIVQFDGADIRSASRLLADCSTPLLDWRRRCMSDQVVANFPMVIGDWNDGTAVPGLVDTTVNIDTTDVVDADCDAATVDVSHTSCEMVLPSMAEIALRTKPLKLKEWKSRFCRMRNIAPEKFSPFNRDGSLDTGEPINIDFMMYALTGLSRATGQLAYETALTGDSSNPYQADGLYTQIDNGWTQSGDAACDDSINIGSIVDWGALTGAVEGEDASPDATTIPGQTITLAGDEFEIAEGMNMVQVLEDIITPWVKEQTEAYGGLDAYEAHVGKGKGKSLISSAACMQPCSTCGTSSCVEHEDSGLRERFAENRRSATMVLYPSGLRIPILETKKMPENQVRFGPRVVGGINTYAMFWAPLDELFPLLPENEFGSPEGGEEQISIAPNGYVDLGNLDASVMMWTVTQQNLRCFNAELMAMYGVLASWRHLWVRFDRVATCGISAPCPTNLTVDGAEV